MHVYPGHEITRLCAQLLATQETLNLACMHNNANKKNKGTRAGEKTERHEGNKDGQWGGSERGKDNGET